MVLIVEVKMHEQKSAQSGFSLVELLVAITILSVGLLGLAELQITATKANSQSDSITVANGLAQKVVEEIAAMDADETIFGADAGIPAGEVSQTWTGSPYTIAGAGVYNVTYDVETNLDMVTGLSQITIHVSSAGNVANVTGNRMRSLDVTTFKRSF